jgi:FAD/FMN-containing dehydrogenase
MSVYERSRSAPGGAAPALEGRIVLPDDERFDEARLAWNLAVDRRPAAVVFPESARDVAAAISIARERGQRVAVEATGHNAGPLGTLEDTLLLKTQRMRDVAINAGTRVVRVEAGVLAAELTEAAARYGLAALTGTSPDVGVVGYTLGGGIGVLARRFGLTANYARAFELVTADGRAIRADRAHEPDLF